MKKIFPHLGESIIYGLLKKNPMVLQRLLSQFDEYELVFDPATSIVPPNSAKCWLEAPDGTARVGFDSESAFDLALVVRHKEGPVGESVLLPLEVKLGDSLTRRKVRKECTEVDWQDVKYASLMKCKMIAILRRRYRDLMPTHILKAHVDGIGDLPVSERWGLITRQQSV